MPYADAFAPPRGIGQGLTGIVAPNYDLNGAGRGEDNPPLAVGPFAPGGAFDPRLDEAREGLAKLFQPQGQTGAAGIDTVSAQLPTAAAAGSGTTAPAAAPSSQSANGLGRLVGPASNGSGGGVSPELTQIQQAIGSAKTANQAIFGLGGLTGVGGVSGAPGAVSGINAGVGTGATAGDVGVGAATLGPEGLEGGVSGAGLAGGAGGTGAIIGGGLSAAGLLALIASMAQSGHASPSQLAGLAQSTGGLSSNLGSILGPAQAGTEAGALSGTIGPELASVLGIGGQVVGGAGALASIGLTLSDLVNAIHSAQEDPRQYATAGGAGVGLGAGALVGSAFGPYGALVGAGVGGAAGDAIGQAIAKNLPVTHYMAQRQHWGEVATDAINAYGFGIQKAASNGGLSEIQQAMSQRYADGHVGAYLTLPDAVAQAIGVPAQTTFDSLNPEQFVMVLKAASQTDPVEYERWIGGQGDVQFLEQGRAQQVADATKKTAAATLTALVGAYQPLLAQLPAVAPEALETSRAWSAGAPERNQAIWSQPFQGATVGSGE